jgi:hypothetical protein
MLVPRRSLLLVALSLTVVGVACAHLGGGEDPRASVDVIHEDGRRGTLAGLGAKVLVLDICAGWSGPCALTARALDEACDTVCAEGAVMASLLLDDPGEQALDSYRDVLGVKHLLLLPGERTRSGKSALGDVMSIPRLVVFGPDGRIVEDEVGGVASAVRIIERVRDLL